MIRVSYSKRFLSQASKLPQEKQVKLSKLLKLLAEKPFSPQLHCKNLTGKLSGLYSFRITREWRVIFQFLSPQEIQLVDVAHRKDIYR